MALIAFLPIKLMKRLSLYLYPTEEKKLMYASRFKKKGKIRKFIEKYLFCKKDKITVDELY